METILIVDDEKNYLLVLHALLSDAGYEVITADSANKAVRSRSQADGRFPRGPAWPNGWKSCPPFGLPMP